MRTLLLAFALSLAALTVQADSADLVADIQSSGPVLRGGDQIFINTFLQNIGPDTAHDVVVSIRITGLPQDLVHCPNGDCAFGDVNPGGYPSIPQITTILPMADFTITVTATVTSSTPDPKPANNTFTLTIQVKTTPELIATFTAPYTLDPGLPFDASLDVRNIGNSVAHHVVVTVDLPAGTGILTWPDACMPAGTRLTCTIDSLSNTTFLPPYRFRLRAPALYEGGAVTFEVTAHSDEPDFVPGGFHALAPSTIYRTFVITSTADAGDGSLRAAVTAANAGCPYPTPPVPVYPPPCALQFNISEATQQPWKTIRLHSPLPALRAYALRIDGATQSTYSGVSNPDGPPIEITGEGRVNGDGLRDDGSCLTIITNLAINGFLGNGISLTDGPAGVPYCSPPAIVGNYIGTDPTGSSAIPNFRGIGSIQSYGGVFGQRIQNNVISGNVRSGVFLTVGSYAVYSNRIGLKAHSEEPLPNGGSGIYLAPDGHALATVSNNTIAFNGEMGVAVNPNSLYTGIMNNRIWGNGGLAIDDGLNGPSNILTDSGTFAPPTLTSAVYDAVTGSTIIRGTRPSSGFQIALFASDTFRAGSGDAQRQLQIIRALPTDATEFAYGVAGDLRGQWVAATITVRANYQPFLDAVTFVKSTELSAPLQVQ